MRLNLNVCENAFADEFTHPFLTGMTVKFSSHTAARVISFRRTFTERP